MNNLRKSKIETNTYNGYNQLISRTENGKTNTYTYDIGGLRKSKTVNGVTTKQVWSMGELAMEINGGTDTVKAKYYHGITPIGMRTSGGQLYYTTSYNGTVEKVTNLGGGVVADYTYDAFGNQTSANENDIYNPFRYCGEYYDEESGLIYLRARYYDSTTGAFINEDPIRDGLNWYVYCESNPVMFVDPRGLNAILLTNRKAVDEYGGPYGHTSAIYQNADGDWFYTYWGDKAAAVIRIPDKYLKYGRKGDTFADSMASLSDFNNTLNEFLHDSGFKNITSDYTDATYVVGDFTESLNAAYKDSIGVLGSLNDGTLVFQGKNGAYDFAFNNCLQVTMKDFRSGTLKSAITVDSYLSACGYGDGIIPNNSRDIFSQMFMNSSFTYSGAYPSIENYANLYNEGSQWAQVFVKGIYANAVVGW